MSQLRISGAVSGLDTDAIVKQLVDLERGPLNRLQAKQTILQAQQSAWRTLASTLRNLESKLEALRTAATYQRTTTTSTDGRVLGTTSSNALPGQYVVTVQALAKAHSVSSATFASRDEALGLAGTAEINGLELVVSEADSLTDIVSRINANAEYGARAIAVQVGDDEYRMVLTSTSTGTAGTIVFGGSAAVLQGLGWVDHLGLTNTVMEAQDAQLEVDGLSVVRSSNSLNDVLPGVTLNLVGEGTAQVRVARDTGAVLNAVQEFVTAYNAFVDFARGQMSYDPQSKSGKPPLHAQSTLRNMHSQLRVLVTDAVGGLAPEMDSLWKIGITTGEVGSEAGRDGKLTVDEAKLKAALAGDLSGVMRLLGAEDGVSGVAGALLDYTKVYTNTTTGLLRNKDQSMEQEMRWLRRQVDTATERLAVRESFLYRKFISMERALSSLQNQASWLTTQLGQLNSWRPSARK